jgi:hypothetical protein
VVAWIARRNPTGPGDGAWIPAVATAAVKGYACLVTATPAKKHDPAKPVATREELEDLLLAGLVSGEPRSVTDEDWEGLYQRALAGMELRKSG